MRKLPPGLLPPQITHHPPQGVIEQRRVYTVITPLFGGGAIQQTWDEVTVIRGTEIRGHLRFWWRATHSETFKNPAALKEQEDKIWGKPNKKKEPGPKHEETIQIEVAALQTPNSVVPFPADGGGKRIDTRLGIPAYAVFPLQLTRDEISQKKVKAVGQEGITFTLTISFPCAYKQDVEAALWAWETFGGVGARTRRGFGSLRLQKINDDKSPDETNLPPTPEKAEEWLGEKLSKISGQSRGWPYVSKDTHFRVISIDQNAANPMFIWKSLIEKLANFRQGKDGRSSGQSRNSYGRSYWPEAETVRKLTGHYRSDLHRLNHPEKFPRAAFGLPIIFHFIREPRHNEPGVPLEKDPEDTTLQANIKGSDRYASPLILKPLLCLDNRSCGIALILEGSPVPSLMLKGKAGTPDHQLTAADVKRLPNLKLNNKTNVLVAFLDYLGGEKN